MTAPHPAATDDDDAMVTKIRKEAVVEITNRAALDITAFSKISALTSR